MPGVRGRQAVLPETQRPTLDYEPLTRGQGLLRDLLDSSVVLAEDWENLPAAAREEITDCPDPGELPALLVRHGLLNEYQADRVQAGKTSGLVLGNYRVLGRLGAGGMGIVFQAEHVELRQPVAIKVLPVYPDGDPRLQTRFLTEMRVVAQLRHPNIVSAIDSGRAGGPNPETLLLRYFVMELVPGKDLEEYVEAQGPLPWAEACDVAHQVAAALKEAHKHHLVHRDIKPSNVRVTPEGQAKLLDFGLARHRASRLTEPGTVLGTLDYMAPEQARDASAVDIRADVYGLGATLFWCLTGRPPFETRGGLVQLLHARLTEPAPSVRALRPDVPAGLDAVVARMMATDPGDRYPTPQAVMEALLPFLKPEMREHTLLAPDGPAEDRLPSSPNGVGARPTHRVLIVDDEPEVRRICRMALEADRLTCDEAADGALGLEAARAQRYDLVLLDIDMPRMSGSEVCRRLREEPPGPNLKVIMLSGRATPDEMARMLLTGADDFLTKPPSLVQLQSRVKAVLRLKDAQDRSDLLNRNLRAVNQELEHSLTARDSDLVQARNALVLALARLTAYRDNETGGHLLRLARYSRILAEEVAGVPAFAGQVDDHFVELLECCAPLHDIGKVGLPDHILLKPGKLDPDERVMMQSHTTIGADTLRAVAEKHGSAVAFLRMATDITRHHHERFDGRGYPDRLAGTDIPLAARIVAIGDVYDALRSRRSYKPALSHGVALQLMTQASEGQFDPALLLAFQRCAHRFERAFQELAD